MMTRRAQTSIEYAIVFACLAAVLIVMHGYIKGGAVSKYYETSGGVLGGQFDPESGNYRSVTVTKGGSESVTTFKMPEDKAKDTSAFVLLSHQASGVSLEVSKEGDQTYGKKVAATKPVETTTAEYSENEIKDIDVLK